MAFDANLKNGTNYPAHTLCGLAGANASGKTALLQALSYVFGFMKDSFLTQAPDEDARFMADLHEVMSDFAES